jgi:hypothetical protein
VYVASLSAPGALRGITGYACQSRRFQDGASAARLGTRRSGADDHELRTSTFLRAASTRAWAACPPPHGHRWPVLPTRCAPGTLLGLARIVSANSHVAARKGRGTEAPLTEPFLQHAPRRAGSAAETLPGSGHCASGSVFFASSALRHLSRQHDLDRCLRSPSRNYPDRVAPAAHRTTPRAFGRSAP